MAGNWKMNPATEEEALALASALTDLLGEETCAISDDEMCTEVVIFPPHPFISKVKETVEEAGITVGAQSIFFEDKVRFYIHSMEEINERYNHDNTKKGHYQVKPNAFCESGLWK